MKENPYEIYRNRSDVMRPVSERKTKDFPWSSNSTFNRVC